LYFRNSQAARKSQATQRMRKRVPNRRTGYWESPSAKSTAMKLRNIQFATAGRTETSETGTQQSAMYVGARYERHRWTVTASLCCGIVSQCRSSRNSRERPRSCFWIPVIRRAAAFWTRCNLSVTYFGADARTEYYGKVKCCNNRLVMWRMNEPVYLPIQHPESDGYVSLDTARRNMSYVRILQCAPVVVLFSFFFVLATLTCHRRVHNNQKNWSWTFGRRTEIGDVRNDCAPVTVAWLMAPIVMV